MLTPCIDVCTLTIKSIAPHTPGRLIDMPPCDLDRTHDLLRIRIHGLLRHRLKECKWKDVNNGGAENILSDLMDKSTFVRWNNDAHKKYVMIVAEKVEEKEELRQGGYLVFDLDDFN